MSNLQRSRNKIILYAMNIHEITLPKDDKWFDMNVSMRTKEKIERLKFADDKKRTLGGELLVRYVMVHKKQIPRDSIIFATDKNGKPYCVNYPEIHFNISHSGSWVICVVNDAPVGVDIEKIGIADMQIAKRFFAECEYYELLNSNENRNEMFYKLWTLKESYIKYTGSGLQMSFNSFAFDMRNENIRLKSPDMNLLYFKSLKVFKNYYLSLCSEEMYKALEIKRIIYNNEEIHELIG